MTKLSFDNVDENIAPIQENSFLSEFEKVLNYRFQKWELLEEALTHRSLINEIDHSGRRDNERLEFLGDAVLGLIIAEWIMETYPDKHEGELTQLRSILVKEQGLARVALGLNLGDYLYLGKGEEITGRRKRSIIADALEAVVGAIYLDGGLEAVRYFVRHQFEEFLKEANTTRNVLTDAKTRVQELLLTLWKISPAYEVVEEIGPDHEKVFVVNLYLRDNVLTKGKGKSKKEAEQDAANRFLRHLQKNPLGML